MVRKNAYVGNQRTSGSLYSIYCFLYQFGGLVNVFSRPTAEYLWLLYAWESAKWSFSYLDLFLPRNNSRDCVGKWSHDISQVNQVICMQLITFRYRVPVARRHLRILLFIVDMYPDNWLHGCAIPLSNDALDIIYVISKSIDVIAIFVVLYNVWIAFAVSNLDMQTILHSSYMHLIQD